MDIVPNLNPKQRELMELLANGLTNKEVAEKMDVNIGTVKSQTFKAIRALRKLNEK